MGRPEGRSRFFVPILAGAGLRDRVLACAGALLGILLTGWLYAQMALPVHALPLLAAPMGASAVLLFAVPASPLAQPWPVLGGNVISALVGVTAARWVPDQALAGGIAVGGAIFAMSLTRSLHPPGGAAALTAVIGGPAVVSAGYAFPFAPVGVNAAILLLAGWLFHRFSGHSYPHQAKTVDPKAVPGRPGFHPDAIDKALADLGEAFDISREDLDLLLSRAEVHEQERRRR